MRKLLAANFSRLFHSKIYWLGMLFMFGLAAFAVCSRLHSVLTVPEYAYPTADGLWFVGGMYISIVLAVFISIWVGTDYSDGTIRNKLSVGHTRGAIYFSNLTVCTVASLMMHLIYIATIAGLGYALLGKFQTPVKTLALCSLSSLSTVVALVSVLVLLAMLIPGKATGAVASMITALVLLFTAITVQNMLDAPEYFENNFHLSVDGQVVPGEPIPNPRYLTGAKRAFYQWVNDFLPGGQMIQYGMSVSTPENIGRFAAYALLVTLITTGCGWVCFRRKDLK